MFSLEDKVLAILYAYWTLQNLQNQNFVNIICIYTFHEFIYYIKLCKYIVYNVSCHLGHWEKWPVEYKLCPQWIVCL